MYEQNQIDTAFITLSRNFKFEQLYRRWEFLFRCHIGLVVEYWLSAVCSPVDVKIGHKTHTVLNCEGAQEKGNRNT